MSDITILRKQFCYQEWADNELLESVASLNAPDHRDKRSQILKLLNHNYTVSFIFKAHLTGESHNLVTDSPQEIPDLECLQLATAAVNSWYIKYVETLTADELAACRSFQFTDGDYGSMSCQEILSHVVIHNGYHRGEVGQILASLGHPVPWDTFAVFLHRREPARRAHIGE
jgi:uncharacterized damage-inducible protein DinB